MKARKHSTTKVVASVSLFTISIFNLLELAKRAFSCCLTAIKSLFTEHLYFYVWNAWKKM